MKTLAEESEPPPARIETHPDSPTVLSLATLEVLILVALFVFLRPAIAECS